MAFETIQAASAEDAREIAGVRGRCLVMAPETLLQLEAAEARGAFEGGMTGNSDGAPFSIEGHAGEPASSASDPPEPFDLDGSMIFSIDGLIERALDGRDLLEAIRGNPLGPVILVPMKELKRLATGVPADNEA